MQSLTLQIKGLFTDPNQLSAVPLGALNRADNVVISRPDVADCRRGQAFYGSLGAVPNKFFQYRGFLLAHYGSSIAYDSDQNGTFVPYTGTFDAPSDIVRIQSFEGNQNLYLTTLNGIMKLDDIFGQFRDAGVVKALYGTATLENPGFMDDQVQVAYRMVWGYTDSNDNEIVGSPSQRLIVVNDTGDTADVVLTWDIPSGIDETYFYRVYRSGFSAGVSFPPDDELQQIKEGNPTSDDIDNGYFTFTDIVPNSLRGASLYTDPSQEGILQANEPPPFALDIALFRNSAFYFNTKSKQRYVFTLIAVGDNTLGGNFGYQTNPGDLHTDTTIDGLQIEASLVVQDITYTAVESGVTGNDISIEYTSGGTAGAEVVTVLGTAISVQIQSGVSTATQVETAMTASMDASELVAAVVTGTGSNPQVTAAQAFLEDGFDTTDLNIGMRVVGDDVAADTVIVDIVSDDEITVSIATTDTGTSDLEFQDAFRINEMTYWAASTADYDERQFVAVLDGTPGEDIEQTALNLVAAINRDPNNSIVYAYYQSATTDLPGQILLEERNINGNAFSVTSTNGESFSPFLYNTGNSNVSDNDAHQNRVMISKPQQPEAVPLLNFLAIGSENFPIVRALALRDSIFVFKTGEGIFRITGTDISNFTVSLFDSSAKIRAPESAVILNNQVFTFSDQGIIVVSENGVQIISIPIEDYLVEISSPEFTNFEYASFGVSYETERQYIFWTLSGSSDLYATQAFIYNTITSAFTRWDMERSAGLVLDRNRKLYTGNPLSDSVYQERKDFNRSDFADDEYDVFIGSYDGDEVTFILNNVEDSSDFESQTGWDTVTIGATISFDGVCTINKTNNNSDDGGIFRSDPVTAQAGDEITFNVQFSYTGSNARFVVILTDNASLDQNGDYKVGFSFFKSFDALIHMVLRDDGTEGSNDIVVNQNQIYNLKMLINGNGTVTISYKLDGDTDYIVLETSDLGNTSSLIGVDMRLMCSVRDDNAHVILSQFLWVSNTSSGITTADFEIGDLLKQDDTEALITSIVDSSTVTVNTEETWDIAAAIVYQAIEPTVEWAQNTSSNPGILKHVSECTVFFKDASFRSIDISFQTDIKEAFETVTLPTPSGSGWGQFPWGEQPWGIAGGRPLPLRTYVPLEMQRASWINFKISNREAFSSFSLEGISAQFEEMSSRQR